MSFAGLAFSPCSMPCYEIKKDANFSSRLDTPMIDLFMKKLDKALNFPKKIREKEEKRVKEMISKVLAKDSLLFTVPHIKKLNEALIKGKKDFDTLVALVKGIQDSLRRKKPAVKDIKYDDPAPGDPEPAFDPDKDLDALVTKMIPILKEKAEEEKTEEIQQQKLKVVRRLLSHPEGIRDNFAINDSMTETYTLRYRKKAELFGYHPYWMKDHYLDYNFKLLSTLAFYAYELNGKTGDYTSTNGWDTAAVITAAQKAGCKVVLAIHDGNAKSISVFLKSKASQKKMITTVIRLLGERHANGAHVMLDAVSGSNRVQLTEFMRTFSKALKAANPSYQLSINVPVVDNEFAYDVAEMNPWVDKFVIDFTKKAETGPIAPLKGGSNSIESGVARYLNKSIPSEKFIACLPYYGLQWDRITDTLRHMPYNKIRSEYADYKPVYDYSSTARIDVVDEADKTDTLEQIWYDDEKTLAIKYDFILKNDLGGIGIWALGYDNDREELWNTLMDQLLAVDTTNIRLVKVYKPADSTLWQKIRKELSIYKLLLTRPCDVNDSIMRQMKSDDYIGPITLFFLVILLIVSAWYIYKIRSMGDDWTLRKTMLRILIALVVIVIICLFLYFFLNQEFSFIGLTKDKDGKCNSMPFNTVISIISTGFLLGLLVMRYLVFPLIKKEDLP